MVFVSNDTDLAPALAAIHEDFRDIVMGVVIPIRKSVMGRPSNEQLRKYASWVRSHITDEELASCHLPDKIPTKKKPIIKPEYW